ncbi:hypothetical protein [Gracilibacillus sp. YIM 98692]|uniref:hypothetical protein n=1 Tax=Gracilibacillus sp. YIM 98692 TaxID=2663532 RepID=UPI0013D6B226|nr:hypothetical protein [Gracilibacillus sp. YIM 98692]
MKKLQSKKDKWTLSIGFMIALYFIVSMILDLPVPSMNKLVGKVFQPVGEPFSNMLESFQDQ